MHPALVTTFIFHTPCIDVTARSVVPMYSALWSQRRVHGHHTACRDVDTGRVEYKGSDQRRVHIGSTGPRQSL
eukprot:NODE_4752_length_336_cov_150.205575_g4143_i0.p2 GENE.NODE_4752_length_336_cov_150.205575_g4143_i0~~NODE_4752_length_336_cov_150.205575_g4143_i0.p2  ORF type:complete len:73 (+),score=24.50 NODE_4752_length_336_cov_150.205575_g4143_i0:76-294(+)